MLHGGEPILLNGEPVGQVTSCAFGHTLERSVAMGYVRPGDRDIRKIAVENALQVDIGLERFAVDASLRPFYDIKGDRARG